MAYDYLKKLFGEPAEGEQPRAMTYAELEAALDADKTVQIVDLKAGGYVSKDKLDSKVAELAGVRTQLDEANNQIQTFKSQAGDAEAIRKRAEEWESKYNTDTKALQDKLAQQARSHAEDMFFTDYKFTSKAARNGVLAEFRAQNFDLSDDGTFRGGKEYIESLMGQDDYKGAFVVPEPPAPEAPPEPTPAPAGQQYPRFASPTGGTTPTANSGPHIGLAELMRRKNADPNYKVTYD